MLSFENDYSTGAHPEILKRFVETNMQQENGYGFDSFTESAKAKIRKECGVEDAQIYFTVGGTQTNQVVISTVLDDTEGVVAATTGHVSVHESGAIEYSGHKVLNIPGHMGKIDVNELESYLKERFEDGDIDHCVFPGIVYITQPTEYGTLYSKSELEAIYKVCQSFELPLYIDGARLGYGLASNEADMTMKDLARLCDVFYIGGTKVGALCGEAIVFTKSNMPKRFLTRAKQRGALVAKGRLLGLQFDTLFTDNLYYEIAKNAIAKKDRLVKVLKAAGIRFLQETPTNQQFVILKKSYFDKLSKRVHIGIWEPYDEENVVVRFATSWSTTDEDIDELEAIFKEMPIE